MTIQISTLAAHTPPHHSSLAPSFVHTSVRHTSLGFDGLEPFARMRQAFVGALHVACQLVLSSKAVLPTEWAADDMARVPLRVLAMDSGVMSSHVVFALGADVAAVIFAGED